MIAVKGMAVIYASILHAHKHFSLVAAAPVSVPVSSVVVILLWADDSTRIFAVAVGTVVGMLGELAVVAWGVRRQDVDIVPRLSGRSAASGQVVAQYLPMVAGALFAGGTTFVDQSMAASLAPGSVASLNYGGRLVAVVIHVLAGGLGTAVLPFFSSLVDGEDWNELRRLLSYYTRLIFYTTPALVVLLCLLSQPIVSTFLERGMFDSGDSALVGSIQAAYAIQIPFYICAMMFVRLASAMVRNQVLMIAAAMSLAGNVILNLIFMELWGVVGIALSTSAVSALSLGYLVLVAVSETTGFESYAWWAGGVSPAVSRQQRLSQDLIWDYFQNEGIERFAGSFARLRFIARRFEPNTRVLNIGIGAGFFEKEALSRSIKVHSLDPNARAVEQIKDQLGDAGCAKVGYCQEIPWPEGFFDGVVMSEVLEQLADDSLGQTLTEVHRVLRVGGLFCGTVPARERLHEQVVVCPCCGGRFHRWGHLQSFDRPRMLTLLEREYDVVKLSERDFVDMANAQLEGQDTRCHADHASALGAHGSGETIYFCAIKRNGRDGTYAG